MTVYVVLDGYKVRKVTEKAVGLGIAKEPFSDLVWLPRSACEDGEDLDVGDTDISVRESMAIEKGLDF